MSGCSGQRHLLLGIVILLLGESAAARQRSNVVLNNPLGQLSYSIQRVAAQVSPAIVQIEILGYIHLDDDKSDDQDRTDTHIVTKTNVIASGVIMGADGYIVTNAHTVNGAKRVRVSLDERVRTSRWKGVPPVLTFDARVVGKCEQADLALLKIDAERLAYRFTCGLKHGPSGNISSRGRQSRGAQKFGFNGDSQCGRAFRQRRSARALHPDRCSY